MQPIIPLRRKDPLDDDGWIFELKLDGFRGLADTMQGRMLSKNGNPMGRFERLLESLPRGYIFDGEIVALDEDGRPRFNDLMFGRREPVYVAFDVLFVDGEDVRDASLKERKTLLDKLVRRHRMQKSEPVLGDGKAAFRTVCGLDLEGIIAKRLTDSYGPRAKWWKILNRDYSQKAGRAELFERRYG
jgi:bifunctional non-homologous end joining protein LigD